MCTCVCVCGGGGGGGMWRGYIKSPIQEKLLNQQCNGHCLGDSAQALPQLKQQLRSALVAAQWRGDTALKDKSKVRGDF